MHWTEHKGYKFLKTQTLISIPLQRIALNAVSLCAVFEKWIIVDPKNNRVLELIFFPFTKISEIHDLKNSHRIALTASSAQESVQKYFHQANKTAEQADRKYESQLQYLER